MKIGDGIEQRPTMCYKWRRMRLRNGILISRTVWDSFRSVLFEIPLVFGIRQLNLDTLFSHRIIPTYSYLFSNSVVQMCRLVFFEAKTLLLVNVMKSSRWHETFLYSWKVQIIWIFLVHFEEVIWHHYFTSRCRILWRFFSFVPDFWW